jgi:hypothetical protein
MTGYCVGKPDEYLLRVFQVTRWRGLLVAGWVLRGGCINEGFP